MKMRESFPLLGRFVRRFWPILRRQRGLALGSLVVMIAEVLLRLLEPWPLSFVIDHVIAPAPGGGPGLLGLSGVAKALDPTWIVTWAALALVAFAGLRAASRYLSAVGFALVGNRLMTQIRNELYRHVQSLSLSFHAKSRSGDLVMRMVGDVGRMRDVLVTALLPLLGNVFILAGMLAVMLWMHWQLALVALSTTPLFWLSTARLSRRIRDVARKQRRREGRLASTASESIGAIETVQALSLGESFSDDFSSASKKSMKEGVRGKRLTAQMERTVDVLNALAQALVLWFGAMAVLRSELTAGELLVFLTYLKGAFRPVRNFAKYSARIAKASAAGERVLELLDIAPDVADRPDAVDAPRLSGELRFEHVEFAYEPGHPVLSDVSFSVPRGARVALVGSSGSGKSTLVGLCLRLRDPLGGRVSMDGRDVREFKLSSLRSQISVVLQDTLLFATSIRENIAAGVADANDGAILEAARLARAHDFIEFLPEGYDTVVGERGVTLSRGQRQRIAIARAALRATPLLVLDEPTTGLDEENERAVMEALMTLSAQRTTLLVTHDLRAAMACDLIVQLERGRLVECGSHEALMELGGRYARTFRSQVGQADASVAARNVVAR